MFIVRDQWQKAEVVSYKVYIIFFFYLRKLSELHSSTWYNWRPARNIWPESVCNQARKIVSLWLGTTRSFIFVTLNDTKNIILIFSAALRTCTKHVLTLMSSSVLCSIKPRIYLKKVSLQYVMHVKFFNTLINQMMKYCAKPMPFTQQYNILNWQCCVHG
jgi:hypothetical protein